MSGNFDMASTASSALRRKNAKFGVGEVSREAIALCTIIVFA
jgi:hypothetical protein